jgi:hypothetical protein
LGLFNGLQGRKNKKIFPLVWAPSENPHAPSRSCGLRAFSKAPQVGLFKKQACSIDFWFVQGFAITRTDVVIRELGAILPQCAARRFRG